MAKDRTGSRRSVDKEARNPRELILEVTKNLNLRDIWLYSSHFDRPGEGSNESYSEVLQEHKRFVQYTDYEIDEQGQMARLLDISVGLGVRARAASRDSDEPLVLHVIEANYVVRYQVIGDVTDDGIKAFAEFNAIHNVWPFWRHHVFETLEKARLPHLDIPLFAGIDL